MSMRSMLAEVSRTHYPNAPATPAQLAAFEAHVGWELDKDLRAFYLHCDGGTLFETRNNANYRFLPLAEIRRARLAIRASDEDEDGAPSVYTLVDMQDSDFIVLDVAQRIAGSYPLFDAWHETFPVVERIASSFGEFLEKALRSGNRSFWLSSAPPER
ncbi:SMI1/KNR4 family protein [Corallococcus sp. BB11-1]|uniref:SMI1/KNR4 family protein n=1 Tax=Corallococcus sp. BB11-1 TaxID=2996783 RepID=UPI0010E9DE19|nr:SMI1/KNR4 family protein [Corallococcus sp. BB11-1]MCY1035075.1 SMI1/KNR4 family protein [Corallococcus sp. BB11-1]RYZ17306.1 MAG: SMI1/KNR4 family protein [Myxococcaceae bacterium]